MDLNLNKIIRSVLMNTSIGNTLPIQNVIDTIDPSAGLEYGVPTWLETALLDYSGHFPVNINRQMPAGLTKIDTDRSTGEPTPIGVYAVNYHDRMRPLHVKTHLWEFNPVNSTFQGYAPYSVDFICVPGLYYQYEKDTILDTSFIRGVEFQHHRCLVDYLSYHLLEYVIRLEESVEVPSGVLAYNLETKLSDIKDRIETLKENRKTLSRAWR